MRTLNVLHQLFGRVTGRRWTYVCPQQHRRQGAFKTRYDAVQGAFVHLAGTPEQSFKDTCPGHHMPVRH
jgi:hypothetical protein